MVYAHKKINKEVLKQQSIAVLGYGSQGRAHALNLRDSGHDVILGLREGGPSWRQAKRDGWLPVSAEMAVRVADVVAMLVPDMVQPDLYQRVVARSLKPGGLLLFAHGFNVHFGHINPRHDLDVGLVAPKSPGHLVRTMFEEGKGVPCLIATHCDSTGTGLERTLAYADGLGGTRAGVIETTFAEETETDLFGEQAVLCGGVTELILAGYETLVDAGYQGEVAYFECLHELKLIVDLIYEGGFERMHEFVSETAIYGDLTRGPRVVDRATRDRMRQILAEIRQGEFAREWSQEYERGCPQYRALLKKDLEHPIEKVGKQLRRNMAWLQPEAAPVQ